jgi:hypothetical protein
MQEMTRLHAEPALTPALMAVGLEAGTLADHVLSYLGTFVDDIAVGITLAMGYFGPNPKKPIDSMGSLKSYQTHADLAPVASLLAELDNPGSWWDLAFKPKAGGRQLLVHNQYLVQFQASSTSGGSFKASACVTSPWADNVVPFPDFFGLLRDILTKLFDWLDRLEIALMIYLKPKDPLWKPISTACPFFLLPVGWPPGVICLDPTYFPLPLCDGADLLPWCAKAPPRPSFAFSHEEISYGAFCIDEEEMKNGRQNDPNVNWFKAKDRLSLIRAGLPYAQ